MVKDGVVHLRFDLEEVVLCTETHNGAQRHGLQTRTALQLAALPDGFLRQCQLGRDTEGRLCRAIGNLLNCQHAAGAEENAVRRRTNVHPAVSDVRTVLIAQQIVKDTSRALIRQTKRAVVLDLHPQKAVLGSQAAGRLAHDVARAQSLLRRHNTELRIAHGRQFGIDGEDVYLPGYVADN